MLRWILRKLIDSGERRLGQPLDYARRMLKASPGSVLKLATLNLWGVGTVSPPHRAVAMLVGTWSQDCGPCLQIAIGQARRDGLRPEQIAAVVRGQALDGTLGLVLDLCRAVVSQDPQSEALSRQVSAQLGEAALIEVAMTLAAAQTYPTIKRTLGMASSCALLDWEGALGAPGQPPAHAGASAGR